MKCTLIFVFAVMFGTLVSQTDSTVFRLDDRMPDGIYLSYLDFRYNRRVSPQELESKEDKTQQEFLTKALYQDKITFTRDGQSQTVESNKVWAYFQNNTFYLNYKGDFYRVPVFGSICYLVANVTVVNPGFYDPRFGYTGGGTSRELRQFVMDVYEGVPTEFAVDKVEAMLARDSLLYADYKKLSRRKQKEEIYRYIRKYNEAHPLYFLR